MMADRILIVDDERFNVKILTQELADRGYAVETAASGTEGLRKVQTSQPHLVLLDYMMHDVSGLDVLRELRRRGSEIPVVMITAYGTIDRAVEAMKEGACDFVTRPFEPDHISLLIQKALGQERLKREVEILSEETEQRYRLIVGDSPEMNRVVDLATKVAGTNSTVLLLGESGTGKEIIARAIRDWGERKSKPFVAINCAGLSKELLESELFGYEQGAFTGANRLKKGKMELAHGGTVFLDEIGDISQELQVKLLRFLQEREFERVGGTRCISVDVRIMAATNCDLEASVGEGLFREDLYHRLNVFPITLPPLRDRKQDIPTLSRYFLRKYSAEIGKNCGELPEAVLRKLVAYDWPGNVRELGNVIERAVVMCLGPEITLEDLPGRVAFAGRKTENEDLSYYDALKATRRDIVLKALGRTGGNRAAAAKVLGLNAKYFLRLIKSLGIEY